ncbi:UDP-N-acetylglucosamine 1-carboxyvinyltransferase, partial [Staphylococcus pseudintermedius]
MDRIIVKGGRTLKSEVGVEGARNAVVPILKASLLASDSKSELVTVPALRDVKTINNV